MKKKLLFLLLAVVSVASLYAQEGEIFVRDFGEAGLTHVFDEKLFFLIEEGESEQWYLDLDYDGEDDFYYMGVMIRDAPWECHNYVVTDFQVDNTSPLRLAFGLHIGDTLSAPNINWERIHIFPDLNWLILNDY